MSILNQQVVGRKSAMSYDNPPHVPNYSWLSDKGQTLAHSETISKGVFI